MFCSDVLETRWFIFSDSVPPLLYYSHIPTAIISVFVAVFVFFNTKKRLESKLLFTMSILFSCLMFLNLVTWTNSHSYIVAFSWIISQALFVLLGIFSAYLYYSFIFKKDINFISKILGLILIVFTFGLTASGTTYEYFDLNTCELIETPFINWYQLFVVLCVVLLVVFEFVKKIRSISENSNEKKVIFIFTFGMLLFLADIFISWQLASVYDSFEIEQYGLFGMPVFMGFLAYLIVRYRAFNIKLLAVQALVVTLAVLIGAQLFFIKTQVNFILTSITFLLSVVFGVLLIRSVKNEIKRKEELQIVTDKLAEANVELKRLDQSKTEFISIASHQLRTPLTAIKGFVSLLLEGSYGAVPKGIEEILSKIYTANERIIDLVEDLLNISRMESGRLNYEYSDVDLCAFLGELRDTFAITAKKRGLELSFECPEGAVLPPVSIDRKKSFEVVSNLIDNALKYTREGSVFVRAEEVSGAVRISVKDTGVGISKEAIPRLFLKFTRGEESGKLYANGTGLGLYVGKFMMEAQGGRIWAQSDGVGKGSTFYVEFPVKQ